MTFRPRMFQDKVDYKLVPQPASTSHTSAGTDPFSILFPSWGARKIGENPWKPWVSYTFFFPKFPLNPFFFLTARPTLRLTHQWTLPLGRAMYSHVGHRGKRLSGGRSCHRTSARVAANGGGSPSTPGAAAAGSSRRVSARARCAATDRRPAQRCT